MAIFTVDIGGRPVVTFSEDPVAKDVRDTDTFENFLRELAIMRDRESDKCLWDGKSEIVVRTATREEAERWKASLKGADGEELELQKMTGDRDPRWTFYLLPVLPSAAN
jgi:hypothetical protein